jgi:hypothetical protein
MRTKARIIPHGNIPIDERCGYFSEARGLGSIIEELRGYSRSAKE